MSTEAQASSKQNYRSIHPDFVPQIVREYTHWTLLVSENQNYLGRMIVWLVREGTFQRLSQVSDEEAVELMQVLRETERALHELVQPDHMNYAWLGNLFHLHGGHGHMHMIPRYARSRFYRGRSYPDKRWGHDYHLPDDRYVPPQAVLYGLRDDMKKAFAAL